MCRENAGCGGALTGGNEGTDGAVSIGYAGTGQNLTLTGTGNLNATGNAAANIIVGNEGDNVITGKGGADSDRRSRRRYLVVADATLARRSPAAT
jgi:hypothetical protein